MDGDQIFVKYGVMNYRFEIPFRLKSKKNNRPIFKNKKTGRVFLGKSREFAQFEQEMNLVLRAQKNKQGIATPLTGDLCLSLMRVEFKGAQRSDLDNIMASIFDSLQDAAIIENDKQFKLLQNIWVIPNAGRDHTTIEIGPMPQASTEQITIADLVAQIRAKR